MKLEDVKQVGYGNTFTDCDEEALLHQSNLGFRSIAPINVLNCQINKEVIRILPPVGMCAPCS